MNVKLCILFYVFFIPNLNAREQNNICKKWKLKKILIFESEIKTKMNPKTNELISVLWAKVFLQTVVLLLKFRSDLIILVRLVIGFLLLTNSSSKPLIQSFHQDQGSWILESRINLFLKMVKTKKKELIKRVNSSKNRLVMLLQKNCRVGSDIEIEVKIIICLGKMKKMSNS